jgi:deoxyribonuclease-4
VIFLGPAGVPLACKERSTAAGIRCVSELGLNAFECEFVRRVGMSNEAAREVGELAERLGVRMSVHCPYFVNLCSSDSEKLEASKRRILDSVERASFMRADIAVFHPGFYGSLSKEEAHEAVKASCLDILDRMKSKGIRGVRLGLETTGKQTAFGTLEEIVRICEEVKGCVPVVDWAHIYARNAGKIDYARIFDELGALKLKHLHTHFTGVEFTTVEDGKGNEKHHLEIRYEKPPFKPLAEEILRRKVDITIISESPILEKDALEMKRVFEGLGYRFK